MLRGHRFCCLVLLLWAAALQAARVPQSALALEISCPSVPAGANAQVRVTLARPYQLASARIIMDFDPAVFGPVAAVDVFSATGDQIGVANIRGRHVDAQFSSQSGGVGRFPGMPIVTVEVPVLASATVGAVGSITLTTGDTPWKDALGYQYRPTAPPGQMKVAGSLSIDSVTPGGGLLPAGFGIRIAGKGFAASTTVQIDGVVVASTVFAGPQAIDVMLGAPADLTGKRVVVRNPDGAQADFYAALRGSIKEIGSGLLIQPIFPLRTYAGAHIGTLGTWFAVQNQNPGPVDVVRIVNSYSRFGPSVYSNTFTVPAGGIHFEGPNVMLTNSSTESIYPAAPIRMMWLGGPGLFSGDDLVGDESPSMVDPVVPRLSLSWDGGQPSCSVDPYAGLVPQPACLAWQVGSSPPAPLVLTASAVGPPIGFHAAVATSDGGQWLSVSPAQGTTCLSNSCAEAKINLKINPLGLAPGEYTGTVTITPAAPIYSPARATFLLRVTRSILSVQGPFSLWFSTDLAHTPPPPLTLQVTGTGDPAPFSVSLHISQQTLGNWVSVTPMEGTTPGTLTVTANPAAFAPGQLGALGYVTITGPANSVTRTVMLSVKQPPMTQMYTIAPHTPLIFWSKAGATTPGTQSIIVYPFVPDSFTMETDRGGAWLAAPVPRDSNGLAVSVDPKGLSAGTYHGILTAGSTAHSDFTPAKVAVTLVIWAEPPPVSVVPASKVFSVPSGSYISVDANVLTVTSGGIPVESTVVTSTVDGNDWLQASYVPYAGVSLGANAKNLPPGTYEGAVKITAPPGSANSVTVPVTLNVTPAVPLLPQAGSPFGVSIVNGASQVVGAVAPGEILSIFGLNIGPSEPAGLSLDDDGKVATSVNGARVLFDDVPAPLVYASATQVNAVVPYEVAGKAAVNIQVELNGTAVTVGGVPVAASAPAIFTLDGGGQDQANALNDDNSSNGPANPAVRGSVIRIFATGEAQTTPPSVTGEITQEDVKKPLLPVSVKIGGMDATVEDAGSAVGQVAGVFQVQARVPQGVAPGAAVPVVLVVGSVRSRDGVTIAVK